MELGKKIKIALDETRMLVMGVQILIGFQFSGMFQPAYGRLPMSSRDLGLLAMLLQIMTLALLIFPSLHHRLVEDGNDSDEFHALIGRIATIALAPFALSLGIDVYLAGERIGGMGWGVAAGIALGTLAIMGWYGLGYWRRRSIGHAERIMAGGQKGRRGGPPTRPKKHPTHNAGAGGMAASARRVPRLLS